MPWGDALYLTVMTLSTVGYGDVVPTSEAGRALAVALVAVGIGAVFYTVSALAGFFIEGRLRYVLGRRAVKHAIDSLRDHVVVCGYGRLGHAVADLLSKGDVPLVVVDQDPSVQARCESDGHLFVLGSAVDDAVLEQAGVARARAIVAGTPSEPDNVFITLAARESNPDIAVHARAQTDAGDRRLRLAGVDQVVLPHRLGGARVANAIVRPAVVEFLELASAGTGAEVDLEEVVLPAHSPLHDVRLRDLEDEGITISVVAIKRGAERIRLNPGGSEVLASGDRVIAVGDRTNLDRLASAVIPEGEA